MADYPKLVTEINTDPRNIGFASMTDVQRAASLNTANISTTQALSTLAQLAWASANGRMDKLVAASADSTQTQAVRNAALVAIELLRNGQQLDVSDAAVQSIMSTLTTAATPVLDQSADIAPLTAMATVTVSWASQNWGRDVTLIDLQIAGV